MSEAKQTEWHRQSRIGLSLAAAVITSWLVLHVYAVFFYAWGWHSIITAPVLFAVLCWLYVGLFIVAHDAMHGSLAPMRPQLNRAVGRLCLLLYAGFDYDALNRKHHLHHRYSGTHGDPDFDERPPHGLWAWYMNFMREYFSQREAIILAIWTFVYLLVFGAPLANLLIFWAAASILSSFQLFYFGTYLPHRPEETPFVDRHRARSSDYGWWWSLLTCFHFGYHHEHHAKPDAPWWRLPDVRAESHPAAGDAAR